MRRLMVAGNLKMNGSKAMINELVVGIEEGAKELKHVDIAIFPPYVYLDQLQQLLTGNHIQWGAQNVASEESGAFTGEVAASMLVEFGCRSVIIGHSERRQYYGDTNPIIAKKFLLAQKSGLIPIICIGETLKQRENNQTFDIIQEQINAIITLENGVNLLQNAILAYEPIWAIGTGVTASPDQAQEVHAYIRTLIKAEGASIAENLRILYGGSVKGSNAQGLFEMPDIDGALVGGACLKVEEFTEICRCKK